MSGEQRAEWKSFLLFTAVKTVSAKVWMMKIARNIGTLLNRTNNRQPTTTLLVVYDFCVWIRRLTILIMSISHFLSSLVPIKRLQTIIISTKCKKKLVINLGFEVNYVWMNVCEHGTHTVRAYKYSGYELRNHSYCRILMTKISVRMMNPEVIVSNSYK